MTKTAASAKTTTVRVSQSHGLLFLATGTTALTGVVISIGVVEVTTFASGGGGVIVSLTGGVKLSAISETGADTMGSAGETCDNVSSTA